MKTLPTKAGSGAHRFNPVLGAAAAAALIFDINFGLTARQFDGSASVSGYNQPERNPLIWT